MKRLVSLLCVLAMAISMFSVAAFAAETKTTKATNVEATTVSDDVAGCATSKGLWYEENKQILVGGVDNMTVQPEKGANLRMWLKNSQGGVKIVVGYTNWLGQWVGMSEQTFAPGERDVLLVSNCNGKKYQVKLSLDNNNAPYAYADFSVLLYQN